MDRLRRLSHPAMLRLADAIESGRLDASNAGDPLREIVSEAGAAEVAQALRALAEGGLAASTLAQVLRALAAERAGAQAVADRYELVWSGDEGAAETRSTSIVVQQLFASARYSLLVASYALERSEASQSLFGALAQRMEHEPTLSVRFFVNVERQFGDDRSDTEVLREWAQTFRTRTWPGSRLPAVFYDPRGLVHGPQRACLHAKCVVADEEVALITSANFTEAAHERNLEAGVLLRDARIALALAGQFESLVIRRQLERVPGL